MTRLRPLIALFTALTLLFALPVAGAEASKPAKRHHKAKAKAKKKRCKAAKVKARKKGKKAAKPARKRCAKKPTADQRRPGAGNNGGRDDDDETGTEIEETTKRIGRISAIDGSTITVALDKGGSITGAITDDTDLMCSASVAADEDDDDGPVGAPGDDADDDPADDDTGDDDDPDADDDDGGERRSARAASTSPCQPAVGDPVYAAELDDFSSSPVFATLDLFGA